MGEKENEAFFFASRWRERHNSKIRAEIQRGSKLSYIRILAETNLLVVQSEICEKWNYPAGRTIVKVHLV